MRLKRMFTGMMCVGLMLFYVSCNQPQQTNLQAGKETKTETGTVKTDSIVKTSPSDSVREDRLDFLRDWNGKYPYEVDLFHHPVMQRRLEKLLGKEFAYLKSIWDVQTPMKADSEYFWTSAMQAHSGGDPGAIIVADLVEHKLFVGIRRDGKVSLFAEENGRTPLLLQEWAE